jgi:hypothetical protein
MSLIEGTHTQSENGHILLSYTFIPTHSCVRTHTHTHRHSHYMFPLDIHPEIHTNTHTYRGALTGVHSVNGKYIYTPTHLRKIYFTIHVSPLSKHPCYYRVSFNLSNWNCKLRYSPDIKVFVSDIISSRPHTNTHIHIIIMFPSHVRPEIYTHILTHTYAGALTWVHCVF